MRFGDLGKRHVGSFWLCIVHSDVQKLSGGGQLSTKFGLELLLDERLTFPNLQIARRHLFFSA